MTTGIAGFREASQGVVPGAENMVLRYEDGGAVHCFTAGDVTVKVAPLATPEDVRDAFAAAIAKRLGDVGP